MQRSPIEILPYDANWPVRFAAERSLLASLFDSATTLIEHIGSTAVPGLGAKPIIDLMVGIEALSEVVDRIPRLRAVGYEYVAEVESAFPERRFFAKPSRGAAQFHLHAVELSTPFWERHLLFRDILRSDPETAARYLALKLQLAVRFRQDREGYGAAKTAFIEEVLSKARANTSQ
jgi:GrpB-like predicted nucleotidyltransferase (UPF0157 family)